MGRHRIFLYVSQYGAVDEFVAERIIVNVDWHQADVVGLEVGAREGERVGGSAPLDSKIGDSIWAAETRNWSFFRQVRHC